MRLHQVGGPKVDSDFEDLWNHPDVSVKRRAAIRLSQAVLRRATEVLHCRDTDLHLVHVMRDAVVFLFASWTATPRARNSLVFHDRTPAAHGSVTDVFTQKVDTFSLAECVILTDPVVCTGGTIHETIVRLEALPLKPAVACLVATPDAVKRLEGAGVETLFYVKMAQVSGDGFKLDPPMFPVWDFGDSLFFTTVDVTRFPSRGGHSMGKGGVNDSGLLRP